MTLAAPAWARNARILGVRYEDKGDLPRIADVFHVNVVILYLVPETSNGWCPQGTYEQVADFTREAHRHGLKVLGYFDSTNGEEKFYTGEHTKWVQENPDGLPQHFQPNHIPQHRQCYCVNSPWRDRLLGIIRREIALGVDGSFLDNPAYYEFTGPSCFCAHCRDKFRRETGKDLAKSPREEQIRWTHSQLGLFLKDVSALYRETAPGREFVVTSNYSGSRFQTQELLAQGENVLFCEVFSLDTDAVLRHLSGQMKCAGKKPLWTIVTLCTKGKEHYTPERADDYALLIAVAAASGASPMLWVAPTSMDPQRPGWALPRFFEIPQFSDMVAAYYSFLNRYQDLFFARQQDLTPLDVKAGPKLVTIGHETGGHLLCHVLNPESEPAVDVRLVLGGKVSSRLMFASPENPEATRLTVSREGKAHVVRLPSLRKWGVVFSR